MNRKNIVLGVVAAVILIIVGNTAYDQWLRYSVHERLIGTWEQDLNPALLADGLAEGGVSEAEELDGIDIDLGANIGLGGKTIPIDLRSSVRFREDSRFDILMANKEFHGHWDLSRARGKKKTVIARVMQTESFEQRLIMHIEFEGNDTIVISDEAGVSNTFTRQSP